jgi:hypothetical protein
MEIIISRREITHNPVNIEFNLLDCTVFFNTAVIVIKRVSIFIRIFDLIEK